MSTCTHYDLIYYNVEAAIHNLEKAVGETYSWEVADHIERQAFFDTILKRLAQSLEENITEVKFRRNASTPVNRLPTEILSHVFSLCSAETTSRPMRKHLLSLSRVCQRWRSVIINNATFWTTIDFIGNVELIKIALQHSKQAKLQIEINDMLFLCPEKLALVRSILTSQTHRIETISAILRVSNMSLIGDALFQPFPSLQYLMIRGDYYKQPQRSQIPFTVGTNNLEVLDLFSCQHMPWTSLQSVLTQVKKLKIRFDDQDSYLNFFTHIQSFSKLKVLSVQCCFVNNLPRISPITVQRLTGLFIQSNALLSLVDSLRTPNLRRLTICDEINRTFQSDVEFDFSSIHYISVKAFPISGFYRFYVIGSTEKDDIPSDCLWDEEFHLPCTSSIRRLQIRMHFNQASTGFLNVLNVLDDVLAKTTAARQVSIPSVLPNSRCSTTQNRVPMSTITDLTPRIKLFTLASVSAVPNSYFFRR